MNNGPLESLFSIPVGFYGKLACVNNKSPHLAQAQTTAVFSEKWSKLAATGSLAMEGFQKQWLLDLYGFNTVERLRMFLSDKRVIIDAGCGLGYKSAWLAEMAPKSIVFGVDVSDAVYIAEDRYRSVPNLFFLRGDIADLPFKRGVVDFVLCDQVIHHTQHPAETYTHLASLLSPSGQFACYVYAKKALPRELIDDWFRGAACTLSHEELWAFSSQMTELGKVLSQLNVKFMSPDVPALGIKGGEYDIQRFIYWNFLKCFYRENWSKQENDACNFDWYSPSNAARYSPEEFKTWALNLNLEILFFRSEEACHTMIVGKPSKNGLAAD